MRAFVHRDRLRVQREERVHRARVARGEPGTAITLSHALYDHARTVSPAFPSEESRDDDFQHHLRLKGLIDRAARAIAGGVRVPPAARSRAKRTLTRRRKTK
jgi:hypothetical protein